jgi:hypothetical protein
MEIFSIANKIINGHNDLFKNFKAVLKERKWDLY